MWIKLISELILQYTIQQKRLEAAPDKIKGMTVQASIYLLGLGFFLVLGLASVITIFSDLGRQWDSDVPTHFSGPIVAALLMFVLGLIVLGLFVLVARLLAAQKKQLPAEPKAPVVNPLMVFGEEFLAQLLAKLNQPKHAPRDEE